MDNTRCNVLVELEMASRRGIKKYLKTETRWTQNNGTEVRESLRTGLKRKKVVYYNFDKRKGLFHT